MFNFFPYSNENPKMLIHSLQFFNEMALFSFSSETISQRQVHTLNFFHINYSRAKRKWRLGD